MSIRRLAKLRAMPPGEIAHRLAYGASTLIERRAHARGRLSPPDRLRGALVRELRQREDWAEALCSRSACRRFFAWEDHPERTRRAFHDSYGPELDKARGIADQTARHEISFFGSTFDFGAAIDWHADPVTGAAWPRRYHRDVPVAGGDIGFGDVKYVWELNRHQFFVDLAKIAFLDSSTRHAEALHAMLRSWQASVPYATGVPWANALEPAFRAWSWLWAYHLVRAAGMLDRDQHLAWLVGLFDHARFLYRHLERHSSPYNHLAGEASALFALGLLLPEFRESASWARRGRGVLESTVAAQFHRDGGSVEQSTFYHHATLGFYLLSAILGERSGVTLSREIRGAIERALEFSMCLAQPDGRLPRIGGADDGKPIRLEHLRFWDFRPYQAIGAVLFQRADFRFAASRFWEDALWILGTGGAEAFSRIESRVPATSAAFPASGYYVVRSDWSGTADYLCFDCGEQAAGLRRDDIPSAAHGHADCLSIVVALGGREVLVDPGFFCYNGEPPWEVHFRKTQAHNTIRIDGRDQARHLSKMAWVRTFAARTEGWSPDGALGWVRGTHDGYARDAGVEHHRTVWLRPDGYLVILDELSGTAAHHAEAVFQFAPGEAALDGGSAAYVDRVDRARCELAWVASAAVQARIDKGGNGPTGGWIATSLGVREPAPRLVLQFDFGAGRAALLTVVADSARRGGAATILRTSAADGADLLLAEVSCGDGVVDRVIAAVSGCVRLPGLDTDAPLVVVRDRPGAAAEARQAGGTRVSLDPESFASRTTDQDLVGSRGSARPGRR